jgi:thiol peroxidase
MVTVGFAGGQVPLVGDLPEVGSKAPAFSLTGRYLDEVTNDTVAGKWAILNIFPSIDTNVCATSVRRFNEQAGSRDDAEVVCISADLPFAAARFCGAEGIEGVRTASTFRSPEFGTTYGVEFADGAFRGLMARAVVVIDPDGVVAHTELVPETGQEPDYAAALAALP